MISKYTVPLTSSLTQPQYEQLVRETDEFIDQTMTSQAIEACNQAFKMHGAISPTYLMHKLKITPQTAKDICDLVHRLKTHCCPFFNGLEIGSNDKEFAACQCAIKYKLLEIDQFKNCQT